MKLVDRQILGLAIPAIVANITTPLLSMVDVTIVGHLGSALYLGAIAVGGSVFNMVYWLFGFLRMGTSGLGAQACGAGDVRAASLVLYRALLLALVGGCVIILFRRPVVDIALEFMGPDMATSEVAKHYFMICVWGAPAVLATYAMSGWLLGMQSSRSQMWV
ncbi:MAG: MATE family efflux transporter, partial [Muribaculaceae bacterium]|nr:MATE family efflux transporter [Muribaculaceae bacterium]